MSDYRDILLKALQEGKSLDSCGTDDRYYDFGLYTDLCGMSVEDAIKATTQCCCGGNGSNTGSTKVNNPIIISAEENGSSKYVVKIKAAYPSAAPVLVSVNIDGKDVTATIPAGSTETIIDDILLDSKYAIVGKIDVVSTDPTYNYIATSNIADGLFVLTYKIEGKTVHEIKVRAGSKIEKFEPEERKGYLFMGWVPEEPETMPEKDTVLNGTYEAIPYYIVFKDAATGDVRIECFYGKKIEKPEALEKEGYEFKGWFMSDGQEVPETLNFIPDGEIEATAKYDILSYILYYQTFDGKEWKQVSVKYNELLSYLDEGPERTGYSFTGWDGKPENDRMPAKDVILKALYEIHKWNLIYSIVDDENPDFTGLTFENVEYDSNIANRTADFAEEHKTDEGKYEFSWIGNEHETSKMPDNDLTIKAERRIVAHTLKFVDEEGNVYTSITQDYNTEINNVVEPKKEGYTFTGWDRGEIPSRMPAEDMTFVSQFDINHHTIIFEIANEKDSGDTGDKILNVAYNTTLASVYEEIKKKYPDVEGEYFFSWIDEGSMPTTMPDEDITIKAKYEAVEHTLTFIVDDGEYKKVTGKFGTPVDKIDEPSKTGYDFIGWDEEIPERYPNVDKAFTAKFEIKQYTVTINDESGNTLTAVSVDYGTAISTIESPSKEGYTFVEYVSDYETVPDSDITIVAKYNINVHKIIYFVDDEKVFEKEYEYHATIENYDYIKEGYTISAWSGLPEDMLMPDKDIEARATSTVNEYNVTFLADGSEYEVRKVAYGSAITLPETEPTKTGYTFKEWKNVPAAMPAEDIEIEAEFEINSYTLTFTNSGETITAFTVEYNAAIADYAKQAKEAVEEKEGFTFSWDSTIPTNMPASDLTIEGSYKEKQAGVAYYGVIKTGITIDENSIKQLNSCPESELEGEGKALPLVIPTNADEYMAAYTKYGDDLYDLQEQLENGDITEEEFNELKAPIEEEFQRYKDANLYTLVIAVTGGSLITIQTPAGKDVTDTWAEQNITIDGIVYDIYTLNGETFYASTLAQNYQHTVIKK